MASFRGIEREAVLKAIKEYDRLGQEGFLKKYKFGKSTIYKLKYNGKKYDSKAIAGVAYGFQFSDKGPHTAGNSHGGKDTVYPLLERLGFKFDIDEIEDIEERFQNKSFKDLREKAYEKGKKPKSKVEQQVIRRERRAAIKVYILKRANGVCEACKENAPFKNNKRRPYLEAHHINQLADGGLDNPRKVIGICPNCHRRAHFSRDSKGFSKKLMEIVKVKENRYKNN